MLRLLQLVLLPGIVASASAHSTSRKEERQPQLDDKWGLDWYFSGISTFAHLPHVRCLQDQDTEFDIAIIGAPFDTSVSYRTGARFGPRAIRAASARQTPSRGYNARASINPYTSWAKILDCGDIPISPYDNALALRQMTEGYGELARRISVAKGARGNSKPKFISLGGDHSIALPELRALAKSYGQPITVLHFDAHLDTWDPTAYPSTWFDPDRPTEEEQSAFTHGTMFWLAGREGLIANGSVHAGLRTRLSGIEDNDSDTVQGWTRIQSDDIAADRLGPAGIAKKIMDTIGTEKPVLLSIDIDVIDPGLAPGTGTPEPGGWLTRELIQVLRGIEDLNVVGADVVEVSPAYDGSGEQTALAAAQVVYEIITSIVKRGLKDGTGDTAAAASAPSGLKDEL